MRIVTVAGQTESLRIPGFERTIPMETKFPELGTFSGTAPEELLAPCACAFYGLNATGALRRLVSELNTVTCTV